MKLVHATLGARKGIENNPRYYGGPEYPEKFKEQFSLLWRTFEAVAWHFQCKERSRKHFLPLLRPCEAHACHYRC